MAKVRLYQAIYAFCLRMKQRLSGRRPKRRATYPQFPDRIHARSLTRLKCAGFRDDTFLTVTLMGSAVADRAVSRCCSA